MVDLVSTGTQAFKTAVETAGPEETTLETEKSNAQFHSNAIAAGDPNAGLIPWLQALSNKGDEANEALIDFIATNPEKARELLFNLNQNLTQNGITEQADILREFQTRQGKYLDKENDRFNQAMQLGMQPWEMMTTVTSLAGAIGMLVKMGVDAGIIPPQYGAMADQFISKAEGWSDHVMANAPYSNLDGFNKSGDIIVTNAFARAGRDTLEDQILAATATVRDQATIEGKLGRAELYDLNRTTAGAFEALQPQQ